MPIGQADVLQITVSARADGQQIINVFHWRPQDPPPAVWTNPGIIEYSGTFINRWRDDVLPLIANNYTVDLYRFAVFGASIVNPSPPPPATINQIDGFDVAGTFLVDSGQGTPPNTPTFEAMGMRKFTGVSGRNWRGGARFGPLLEANSLVNEFTAPTIAAWQAAVNSLFTVMTDGFGGNPMVHCVFSRTLHTSAVGRPARTDTRAVTSHILNPFVTSQVSRKRSIFNPS